MWGRLGLGGGFATILHCKLAVTVDGLVVFACFGQF